MQRASSVTFAEIVIEAMRGSRFAAEEEFIQHGNTSCLLHSIAVAYFCYRIANKLGFLEFRLNELVREHCCMTTSSMTGTSNQNAVMGFTAFHTPSLPSTMRSSISICLTSSVT